MKTDQSRMLSEFEAAKRLGVSISWLRKRRQFGGGPVFAKFGSAVRYPEKQLHEYIETCTVSQGAEKRETKPWTR